MRITLREVVDDSRCPMNANCVWEGDAAVALTFERAGAKSDVTLHTASRIGPTSITLAGVEYRLFGLTPFPVAGAPRPDFGVGAALLVVKR